jgi:hypothetical protein
MIKTHTIIVANRIISQITCLKMSSTKDSDSYVYSLGSICGTVPYSRVITALITFLETTHIGAWVSDTKATSKAANKMEEWNVMRSSTLSSIRTPIDHMDTRLFDVQKIDSIRCFSSPEAAIKYLEKSAGETGMQFKFE